MALEFYHRTPYPQVNAFVRVTEENLSEVAGIIETHSGNPTVVSDNGIDYDYTVMGAWGSIPGRLEIGDLIEVFSDGKARGPKQDEYRITSAQPVPGFGVTYTIADPAS